MSNQTRQKEEKYIQCDWCGRDIEEGQKGYTITGDFPSVHVHEDNCLRQAVSVGIRSNNKSSL